MKSSTYIPLFLFLLSLVTVKAWESPNPPDYNKIFNKADLVVLAQVEKIIPPTELAYPTEVILKIHKVLKGKTKKGDLVHVFHSSSEAIPKIENGMISRLAIFQCPPLSQFKAGEEVLLYAEWDAEKKRYFVPGHRWKITQTK